MNLPEFSVKKPYIMVASLLIILLLGVLAFNTLQVKLYPDLNPTVVTVLTEYTGASAEDIDDLINESLEEELATVEGVQDIKAKAQQGISVIDVEFGYDKDIDVAAMDVQNVVDRNREELPADITEPQVLKVGSGDKPVLTLAVTGLDSFVELRSLLKNEIKPKFQVVKGVSSVNLFGGLEKEVVVEVDKNKLKAYGIPINTITQKIKAENLTSPAGKITTKENEYLVRAIGEYERLADLGNIIIGNFQGSLVQLNDIAQIKEGHDQKRSEFRANGKEAVAINIKKTDAANTVEVVKKTKKKLAKVEQEYSQLNFTVVDDQSDLVNVVVTSMIDSLRSGIILTIIILTLFLINLRSTLIVALSIPATFLVTLGLFKTFGLTLNMVTMTGLILAIGMLVDDSIVVIESIIRHANEGKSPARAAIDGTQEIMLASMAGTTTSIIVLLPLIFVGGFVQQMFKPLSLTLLFAWTASVFLSLTLIPFLASLILRRRDGLNKLENLISFFDKGIGVLQNKYKQILDFGLDKWYVVIPLILIIFAGAIRLVPQIGVEKLPQMDSGQIRISLEAEPGSSLAKTSDIVKRVEKVLTKEEEIITVSSQVGIESGTVSNPVTGAIGVQQASISAVLTDRHERQESIWGIQDRLRRKIEPISGLRSVVVNEVGSTVQSTIQAPFVIKVFGDDLAKLNNIAEKIETKLASVPGLVDLETTWTLNNPEYHLDIDHKRLGDLHLTTQEVVTQTVIGIEGWEVSKFKLPNKDDLDVRVKYQNSDQAEVTDIGGVMIKSPVGSVLPLKSLVDIKRVMAPNLITREKFKNKISVIGYNRGRPLSKVSADINSRLKEIDLPAGYQAKLAGQQEELKESTTRMGISFILAILLVYIILVAQFKSFVHPLIIMLAVPLELIGVIGALWLTGKYISLPAIMGIILLTGIVVNNSILLLDRTLVNREQGMEVKSALLEAAGTRFRPILMTATSTIVGMLPLALALATGSERFAPLAISVIGGLIISTFLTLILVPVVYNLVGSIDFKDKLFDIFNSKIK